ncbi:ENDOD1: Endonuclease domain-containing 1 protein [Crotalus adamanteus]|uniref:ENDOD1: Endonuclease domain-containing 1 protein n=1 Tax=Crotalus adamanteus TaxID=8729 RepID=A0AAW1BD81_CROAD
MWLLWILPLAASFFLPATGKVVSSFRECSQFFLDRKYPSLAPGNPARICQRYKNQKKGQHRFATMYDTHRHIPIFSAYILYPYNSGQRIVDWKIEPQVKGVPILKLNIREMESVLALPWATARDSMESEQTCGIAPNLLKKNQAVSSDYAHSPDYNRGHLAPVSHQLDQDSKDATFTLTNIVPQFKDLNNGQWKEYEEKLKLFTTGCYRTYAIVGVVPGNIYLSNRVNIPSHIWAAVCCVLSNQGRYFWGMIAKNSENYVHFTTDLKWLENELKVLFDNHLDFRGQKIDLFNGACYNYT